MSEEANSVSQICENSLTTLKDEVDPEELPPRTISHTTRRSRFGTGNVPLSPYILIDGRKLRSSLALSKKKLPRRVSFPTNDNHLITGYLEPANPWILAENVNCEDVISAYKESCLKHNSDPLETIINQLETQCLEHLEAKDIILNEQYMNILSRALRLVCHLHVLKLENCGLSGRSIITLVAALKMNTGIRELYLADNGLNLYDAIQLGSLLRLNNHIQLLDISNNVIQDDGVRDILEGLINQVNEDKDGKGLNILILWNNQLTKKSSPYFARIIALSKTLETLNIGKNMLTDELLFIIKDALKKNRVLLQLGIQSTELTCRIDLRNNKIHLTGMEALNSAMKKNKNITKIDLDDKPDIKMGNLTDTLHQYTQLVAEIRSYCLENEKNRKLEENSEGFDNSYHSRFCSTTTRKISLTCQTLPCSLSSMISIQKDESGRSMLEPKRINGGRLRSPAPSPASSPIASPILSPSRSRFVVSRVPETLRSTESSVPSSSILSSVGSSPTCVTSASGSSRFRVSVVESANTVSLPKPVITTDVDTTVDLNPKANLSSKVNITESTDLSSKVNIIESTDTNDSNIILASESGKNNDHTVKSSQNTSDSLSRLALNEMKKEISSCIPTILGSPNTKELNTSESFVETRVETQSDDCASFSSLEHKENGMPDNQSISELLEDVSMTRNIENVENCSNESAKDTKTSILADRKGESSPYRTISDKSIISNKKGHDATDKVINISMNESIELQSQTKHDPIQKSTSNLGKLLSLFQHSSCFFSDSTAINQLKNKNTLQGSINSMMTLGDKFHYYIKDKRDRIYNRETEESSVSLKSKSKFFNVSQLPSLQSLANMIPSFRFEGNLNAPGQSNKPCSKEVKLLLEKDSKNDSINTKKRCAERSNESKNVNVYLEGLESSPTLDNQLFENVHTKFPPGVTNKDVVLAANCIVSNIIDTCSKIVNNNLLMHVSNSNTIVPVPKLIGIPEYSALKAATNDVQKQSIARILDKVDPVLIKKTNNETLTDSINFTSDSNSLSCGIMYDVSNDVHTVHTSDRMHNLVILNLSTKDNNSAFNVNSTESNTACFVCNQKCVCSVNNRPLECYNTSKINVEANCLNNEVTRMYSIDSNSDKNVFINVHNTPTSNKVERNVCHVNNSTNWESAVVNNEQEAKISKINCTCKANNSEFSDDSTRSCTSVLYTNVNTSIKRGLIEPFVRKHNKYIEISNMTEMKINSSVVKNIMDMFKNMNIVMPIPRVYSSMTNFNILIFRDLRHHVADISVNETPIKKLSPDVTTNNWLNNIGKIKTLFYDLSQMSHSSLNAITEKPENIHNNDEALKIEENSSLEDHIEECANFHNEQTFKENEAFGIVSEYPSSVPVIVDSIVHSKEDTSCLKGNDDISSNLPENIHMLSNFGSNIAQHLKCTNSDDINDKTHQYLNAIKCAVATTMCSTAVVSTKGNTTVDIISDQSTNIAEPSSVISATR
ncbi:Protein phosphatase 1 regulatory subunit 37 [Melipona quadrifasciata]|uniref:Protein phosphatase 1 regulatory subunit 37 n=1 Tax=Melipona quadrifasciata TaxID=166423 RepID=A0A0N0BBD6_9HYME|nr:Protein phosphatase 1 regulatory subunit 37 [Melipona quadrifasciata]